MGDERPRSRGDASAATDGRPRLTRRRALTVLGTGFVGTIGTVVAQDRDYEAEVWREGDVGTGTWYAANGGSTVHSGGDMIDAIQAAVDSLSSGRTTKEAVLVQDSGVVGPHEWDGDLHAIDLPSYTVLDVPETITVQDDGENLIAPVRAQSAQSIEIPRLSLEGNPRYGVWIQSCSDVRLGDLELSLSSGLGIRIDDNDGGRSSDVSLESAFVEGSGTHAVETYGVDGIDVGRVETRDTGGCGLLLNDTSDASVEVVDAIRADEGGGYAAFRVANYAGPNIRVGEVISRDSGRGVFGVSGSHGFTVESVDIVGSETGILVQDCQDVRIEGGTVRNCTGEGVRIDSRSSDEHPPAENVTVRDLRVVDDRANRQQAYGIYETGPDTGNNAILDNDLRNAGTVADLEVYASSTVVEGNVLTGEDPGTGGETDGSGEDREENGDESDGPSDEDVPRIGEYEPADTTGDGLYNDVTGSGSTTTTDVTVFFENVENTAVADYPEYYDFDGNGQVSISDVVDLFEHL